MQLDIREELDQAIDQGRTRSASVPVNRCGEGVASFVVIRILLRMAGPTQRSYDVHVPNKTIYVSDGDLPIYQRAQELAGDNLSAAIAAALRRYVDVEEGRREGFDEIIVRVGPGKGRKVRFVGVLLGEWLNTSYSRVETFRVYRGRTGKFVLHIERSAGLHDGRRGGQAGRLARLPRRRQHQLRVHARRVDPRRHRHARRAPRADPAAALRHGRRLGTAARLSRISTSDPRPLDAVAWAVRHDGGRSPVGDPAPPACASRTASRSSSTASTLRSPKARSSPSSGRTAPARRRRSRSSRR